jgi:predicted Zn-dependent protease
VLAASLLGAVLESQGIGGAADVSEHVAQGMATGHNANHSRDQELQAEPLGAKYLARSRYNPSNMVDVMPALKSQDTHAADLARAAAKLRPVALTGSRRTPATSSACNLRARAPPATRANTVTTAASATCRPFKAWPLATAQSKAWCVVRGAWCVVRGAWSNFYYLGLGIAVTAQPGWRIQHSPSALSIVSRQAGAALRMLATPPKGGSDHEDILKNSFGPAQRQLTRSNLNSLTATHFAGMRRLPNSQTQLLQATVVTGPNNTNCALLDLATSDAAKLRVLPAMNATEKSLRPMGVADARIGRPWVVDSAPWRRGGFAALQTPNVPTEQQRGW